MQRKILYSLGLSLILLVSCKTTYHLTQEKTLANQSVNETLSENTAQQATIAPVRC